MTSKSPFEINWPLKQAMVLWGKHSLARSWIKVLMMRMTTTCATPRPRRLLRISYVLCMWHVETRLPSWRTRRLDIYLFFQTTHVYDEKFPIPTILVCMRAKKIPKGRAAGAARRGAPPPPLVHSNKERLGAKRGLFCARRCSGMCAIALLLYPPRPA